VVRIFDNGESQSRMVKSGSSYLSQSELPVTFGVGRQDIIERATIEWPSGGGEEFKNIEAAHAYECVESKGLTKNLGF
jgi:enediyne biosynthesis protein E4